MIWEVCRDGIWFWIRTIFSCQSSNWHCTLLLSNYPAFVKCTESSQQDKALSESHSALQQTCAEQSKVHTAVFWWWSCSGARTCNTLTYQQPVIKVWVIESLKTWKCITKPTNESEDFVHWTSKICQPLPCDSFNLISTSGATLTAEGKWLPCWCNTVC